MSMYIAGNPKSKKAFKAMVEAGEDPGYYQPGPFGGNEPLDGTIYCEGPHYPQTHRWYASAKVANGHIVPGSIK